MADLRVPLDTIEALIGRCHRLHTADDRLCKPDKPFRNHRDLIRMRRPYIDPVRVALEEATLLEDIYLDRTESPTRPLADCAPRASP